MTTSRAEDVLYSSLTEVEPLEQLARIGLEPECIPKEDMRKVVAWALDYFKDSGQTQAPSREALFLTWGQQIEDLEIEIAEEDVEKDLIGWAIMSLKSQYVLWKFQQWQKDAALVIHEASMVERLPSLEAITHGLVGITLSLRDRTQEVEGVTGIRRSLVDYEKRASESLLFRGMSFGIPEVDQYTYGIHPGELAVLAAGPKTGKSVTFAYILLNEWKQRRFATLFTLENSVDMTYDRLVCMMHGIDHDLYRRGLCMPEQMDAVKTWLDENGKDLAELIHVVQPEKGQRTVQWITQYARTRGTQSLLIDQLTFMEASHRSLRGPDKIADVMHELKSEVAAAEMSCGLAHQINREGMKEAKKSGYLEMHMLAEGSEVERTADLVLGLYASPDEMKAEVVKLQTLAFRRQPPKSFRLAWRPWIGHVESLGEFEVSA